MEPSILNYLLIINAAGFILNMVNILIYKYTEKYWLNTISAAASVLGGSPGVIASILLFDRKARKENMMLRIFVICVFIVQIVLILCLKSFAGRNITFDFVGFFEQNRWIAIYFLIINTITFTAFALDKYFAVKHCRRISIVTLLSLSFFGGAVGGLLGMYGFRHKTQKNYFTVGLPMILIMQLVLIFYIMNL